MWHLSHSPLINIHARNAEGHIGQLSCRKYSNPAHIRYFQEHDVNNWEMQAVFMMWALTCFIMSFMCKMVQMTYIRAVTRASSFGPVTPGWGTHPWRKVINDVSGSAQMFGIPSWDIYLTNCSAMKMGISIGYRRTIAKLGYWSDWTHSTHYKKLIA